MYLSLIISLVIAFLLAILIFKLLSKTFKLLVFLIIFGVIFGLLYFGSDAITSRINMGEEPAMPSSQGCSSDSDCAFVANPSNCKLIADSCNNIMDTSKFFATGSQDKCLIDSVVINPNIRCFCRETSSGSSCERL